jgi:hypothetical protein
MAWNRGGELDAGRTDTFLRRVPVLFLFVCTATFAQIPPTSSPASETSPSASTSPSLALEMTPQAMDLLQITGVDPDYPLVSPSFEGSRPNSTQSEPALKPEFIAAPIPFYNPGLGAGLGLAAGYIFPVDPNDRISPPSMVGAGGFYSSSGSAAFAGGAKLFLDEDRYRLTLGAAHATINTDFYGVGNSAGQNGKSIALTQEFTGGVFEVLRQTIPHLYVGGHYVGGNLKTSIRRNNLQEFPGLPVVQRDAGLTIAAAGLRVLYDDTDSQFFPTKGWVADFQANFFANAVGSDREFQVYSIALEHYLSLGSSDVLAFRGFGRYAGGNAPFWALSSFGIHNDLRGYDVGRYRDKMMLAGQVELRHQFSDEWTGVVFAGVGEVAPDLRSLNFDDLLPSAGAGIRYMLSKKQRIGLRLDAAVGRDGPAIYFGIGEAF